jgi:hypothetical protein
MQVTTVNAESAADDWNDDSHNGWHEHTITRGGDSETRPINASVRWIIKY